jgi:hypothetical protein
MYRSTGGIPYPKFTTVNCHVNMETFTNIHSRNTRTYSLINTEKKREPYDIYPFSTSTSFFVSELDEEEVHRILDFSKSKEVTNLKNLKTKKVVQNIFNI